MDLFDQITYSTQAQKQEWNHKWVATSLSNVNCLK